ncbi:CocE/NonD family hydrolase [Lysobacter maris]|uniref:CocE/NonD family hydrolase n=1 Tax=Marilutibacter maris TaxID=1605891 RepID=A0A507ZYS4_9GAMM|nr:CocE/NonD family hydrolase [Lysobacter maris]KAB8162078.1 CocE/NonD family hydrolase [Lysobacter maris]
MENSAALAFGPFAVVALRDVEIRMRDGVVLATDLYLPRAPDGEARRWPCILERTPYDKGGTAGSDVTAASDAPMSKPAIARWFASHGYAMAMQDCRGRYASGGEFTKYLNEGEDGVDTVAWLAEQDWSNGWVLTQGLSYCAHAQTALGSFAPAALFAQFVDSGGFSNAYQGGIRQGGAFELKQATWALKHALLSPATAADPVRARALRAQDMRAWFARMPWRRGDSPVSAAPEYEEYLFDQWERADFGDYWKQRALCGERHYDGYADVPMVHMSSWYDPYVRTAIDNYLGLSRRKRAPVHLIMGPWTHGRRSQTHAGDVDFGPDASFDRAFGMSYFELRRRWYDHLFDARKPNPLDRGRVSVFVMGGGPGDRDARGRLRHGGRWLHADRWPLPDTRERAWYLHAPGGLDPRSSRDERASRWFDYDPAHPVPTLGGTVTSADTVMLPGAYDQREAPQFFGADGSGRDLGERPDVISFRSAPLTRPVEVIGAIRACLYLSSDCPDTDITIKLIDEYPPGDGNPEGFAMNLTDGILRVRYRESWERPSLLEPGQVVEITVEAFATANLFAIGHRIRLDVSSSNYPHFDLNPNTGGALVGWKTSRIARNTLHLDRSHRSRLILPVRTAPRSRD